MDNNKHNDWTGAVRERLESRELTPSDALWERIGAAVPQADAPHKVWRLAWGGAIGAAAAAAIAAILFLRPAGTREDHLAYRIWSADGQLLGSVAFEPVAGEGSALPVWTAVDERFDFSACFKTSSLVVPADYQVYLGTMPLGPEWIREEGLPYQSFADITEPIPGLPVLVRYETPPFLGEPALWVVNEKGEQLRAEDLNEGLFLDRCPEEIRGQIEEFLPDFVNLYVLFSADIRDSAGYYYGQLKPMVLPDSPLYEGDRVFDFYFVSFDFCNHFLSCSFCVLFFVPKTHVALITIISQCPFQKQDGREQKCS